MRELCLIIPLLLSRIYVFAADGVDGCHIQTGVTMQSRLYYTPYILGDGSPTQWIENSIGHSGYNLITPSKYFENTNIPCKVYDFGTTSSNPPSAVAYSGYYSVVATNCPIDEYIPAFFIFTTLIAVAKLRKFRHENINYYRCL